MRRAAFLAAALLVAGCHRAATLASEEGAEDQNRTAAKTLEDLAAADRAAAAPMRDAQPRRDARRPRDDSPPGPTIDNSVVEDAPTPDQDSNGA